jgi:hypothetical protein
MKSLQVSGLQPRNVVNPSLTAAGILSALNSAEFHAPYRKLTRGVLDIVASPGTSIMRDITHCHWLLSAKDHLVSAHHAL